VAEAEVEEVAISVEVEDAMPGPTQLNSILRRSP
jgi:hypothetical protein